MRASIKRIFLFLLLSCSVCLVYSQIGIGINPPDPSAMLHVQDTEKGLLIPRMTAAQRTSIQTPAEGLMVYQTDAPAGFWYYRGGQWINTFPSNGAGKNTLILADSITNAEAQLKIATESGPNTQVIKIQRCVNLTLVDLSVLTNSVLQINMEGNPVLQNVNLGNLTTIDEDIYINNCPQLTTLNVSSLARIGQASAGHSAAIQITNTGMQVINFPVLKNLAGQIYIENNTALNSINIPQVSYSPSILIQNNALLANISFHDLKKVNAFFITAPALTTTDFQSLTTGIGIQIVVNQLQSLSFPSLQVVNYITITAPQLSTVNLSSLLNGQIDITGGSLNAVNFNSLLNPTNIKITATSGSLSSINFPALQTVLSGTSNAVSITGIGNLSFPVLKKVDDFAVSNLSALSLPLLDTVKLMLGISNAPSMSTLSFPALKKAGTISISGTGITSVSFPSLITVHDFESPTPGYLYIAANPNLTSISWPNFFAGTTKYSDLHNNKLPSSEVNAILAKYRATPPGVGSDLYLRQIPAAPPTGQGITDKNFLISAGTMVDTD